VDPSKHNLSKYCQCKLPIFLEEDLAAATHGAEGLTFPLYRTSNTAQRLINPMSVLEMTVPGL